MEKEYTYSAFISYSHEDEKIAKILQRKLERYRLPTVLQKQYKNIPEKMHIFLDQGDIVPGDTVENALCRELADSKKLIVICSPNSAASAYVELEVKKFISMGHSANDIIPYIIDGEVDKLSLHNCYVPSLFGETGKDTINGVSVVRDGKWKAFVGVLANLLELKYDEIYKREKVRKNKIIIIWTLVVVLIAFFIGLCIWYITPHTKYYADYITKWEVPEGIYRLSKKQIKEYPSHYEITTKFLRPIKIIHANSRGFPVQEEFWKENQNRPIIAEYRYKNFFSPLQKKSLWQIQEAIYHFVDQEEIIQPKNYIDIKLIYTFSNDLESCYVDFYYNVEDNIRTVLYPDVLSDKCIFKSDVTDLEDAERIFFENNSTIYRLNIEFDSIGYSRNIKLMNKNNLLVSDKNGITSWSNEFDENGRIIAQNYVEDSRYLLGVKKELLVKRKEIRYKGVDVDRISFFSQDGKLEHNFTRGYAESIYEWKKNNLPFCHKTYYKDKNGISCHPKIINGHMCEEVEDIYDRDFILDSRTITNNLDIPKNLPENLKRELPRREEIAYKYNEHGRIISISSYKDGILDNSQNVLYTFDGFIQSIEKFNSKKEKISISIFERQENEDSLIIKVNSLNNKTYKYDKYKRLIEQSIENGDVKDNIKLIYYGDNKSICFFRNNEFFQEKTKGFSRVDFSYTNEGNLNYIAIRSSDGNLAFANQLGFSEYKALYSPGGFLLKECFLNQEEEFVTPYIVRDYAVYNAKLNVEETFVEHGEFHLSNGEYPSKKSSVTFDTKLVSDGKNIKGVDLQ